MSGSGLVGDLRRLQRRLQTVAAVFEKARETLDAVACEVEQLADRISATAAHAPRKRPISRTVADRAVMHAEAEAGASSLRVKSRGDGAAEVSVNGRRGFLLRPKLAALLTVISAPGGDGDDHRIGWRSTTEVAAAVAQQTGRAMRPRQVPKLVFNLREALRDAGENWLLVQTHRDRGVRFALRVIEEEDPS